jgi:nitrogen fixation NifU-like protein
MAYSEKVIDHYENPRNVGSFEKGDESVGTGMVGAPACGDVMKLQIKVNKDGIIEDARFKTYGCGSAIASSSLVTEWVKGKSLDEALTIKNTQIAEELALPPVKIHCSILAEDAIKAAVADYRKKHAEAGQDDGEAVACALFAGSFQTLSPFLRSRLEPMRLGSVHDPGLAARLALLPATARAAGIFDHRAKKHSAYGRCGRCRFARTCHVCPVAIGRIPGNEDPDRIPDHLCAFNRVFRKWRETFPVTTRFQEVPSP